MMLKIYKTVILSILLGSVFFLVSCEKEKIKYDNVEQQEYLPQFCEDCHMNSFQEHSTNAHAKHTKGIYEFECSTCHFGHGWEVKTHMNAEKNITFNPYGLATRNGLDSLVTPEWDSETKTCKNIYCHSNGVSADRGTDGTYTWSSDAPPFGQIIYAETPSWNNGKIDDCIPCHIGKGNMTEPYLIERPNVLTLDDYPVTGQHRLIWHLSNNKEFAMAPFNTPFWDGVQCFWCHSASTGDEIAVNGPTFQGSYGTKYHVDGVTLFKPLKVSEGGTMLNGSSYSSNGTEAHCGAGKKCWKE